MRHRHWEALTAAQPAFAQGFIFAPDKDWAQLVIDEMATFPKGKHDDYTDRATQSINYLRSAGLAFNDGETLRAQRRPLGRVKKPAIYPI